MAMRKQRIEGRLDRSFPADIKVIRSEGEGAQTDNVRLELSFSSETPYLRSSWFSDPWVEVLGHDAGEVDLSRLQDGAPVLANHDRYGGGSSPLAAIGVVERADLSNRRGMATIKLSRRQGMEGLLSDIADGIVRNVSVGYRINERTLVKDNGGKSPDEYRVTSWTPMEVSLVDIPADASVGIGRSQERNTQYRVVDLPDEGAIEKGMGMDEDKEVRAEAGATAAPSVDVESVRQEAAVAERQRIAEIGVMGRAAKLDLSDIDALVASGTSADAAGRQILAKLAERSEAAPTRSAADIVVTRTEIDTRRELMGEALTHRANPAVKLSDGARQYRGMDLVGMARDCLETAGMKTRGLSRREVAVAALNLDRDLQVRSGMMSTSDFPNVLGSAVNRTLRQRYELAPKTHQMWARASTAPDFRQVARTQLSEISAMKAVSEGGEYKNILFGDSAEKYSLGKYGGIIALTWETIVNDDLNAFDRLPQAVAEEAAALEGDIVYGILLANAAMADGTALFHASHGNLPTAAAITDVTLGVARTAMRKQTGPQGRVLNLTPTYLVVGPDKEAEAYKYTSTAFVAAKSVDINPAYITALQVIVDARITGNKWYLMASPGRIDTVEYAYLEGENGIYTEQRMGFEVDGLEIKARLVFAAKAIDWRGMQYNSGA